MFNTFIVQPVINLLVLIYALLPGHNFGVAIILFTVVVRLLMWPLVKKQLHHAKAMRELQPELKRIKKEAKGDRQKESTMTMALYKEKEINPFSSIGLLIVQIPILIALYSGISKIIKDPHALLDYAYPFVEKIGNLPELAANIDSFDATLFGFVDLTKAALVPNGGGIYWPAMILVIGSAVTQYYQSKQLMPSDKDSRKLRDILKDAGSGKQADQSEVNNAVGRSTRFFIPAMIFIFTVNLPSALSLYWLTSGLVAIIQQNRVLGREEKVLEDSVNKKPTAKQRANKAIEAEVVVKKPKSKSSAKKKKQAKKKGRK